MVVKVFGVRLAGDDPQATGFYVVDSQHKPVALFNASGDKIDLKGHPQLSIMQELAVVPADDLEEFIGRCTGKVQPPIPADDKQPTEQTEPEEQKATEPEVAGTTAPTASTDAEVIKAKPNPEPTTDES